MFLVVRWGTREGLTADSIYSVAVWAIVGGVVGARLLHVVGQWSDFYQNDPIRVLYVWQGGVTIYGAILGGFVGGALYIVTRNSAWYLGLWGRYFKFLGEPKKAPLPGVGRLADIAAPAMLISQAIGRVGDIINGEHFADPSSLPWAVIYSHPESPGRFLQTPTHPAVAYELLMDLAILGLLWPLRKRLRPDGIAGDGRVFCSLFSFLLRRAILPQLPPCRVQRIRGLERSPDHSPGSNCDHDSAVDIQGPAVQARDRTRGPAKGSPETGALVAQPEPTLLIPSLLINSVYFCGSTGSPRTGKVVRLSLACRRSNPQNAPLKNRNSISLWGRHRRESKKETPRFTRY